jgi:hypothetical protein
MRAAGGAWTALAAALLAACGGGDASGDGAPGGWSSAVDSLPDGRVVVVHSPPADDPWAPTWALEEELRIGTVDGAGPESFAQVKAVVVDGAGRIAVLEGLAQEIRVFGPDGAHLATFGGKGGGPGELQNALGMMLRSDGRLLVPDQGNARMSVFDFAGGFVESFPLVFRSWGFVWDGALREDGHVLMPSVVVESRREMIRVLDSEMRQVDSILLPPRPEPVGESPGDFRWESADGSSGAVAIPFYPREARLLLPSGELWSASAGDPSHRVSRWAPAGDTSLVVETRRPLVPVSEAERDSAMEGLLSGLRRFGVRRLDASRVPRVKPGVLSLFTDDADRLWVGTSSPDSLRRYDVFEPDGRLAGAVATSLDVPPWLRPVVVGDQFYGVVWDELGVPFVVRARVTTK